MRMAFYSNDIHEYVRITENPAEGIKIVEKNILNRLKVKNQKNMNDNETKKDNMNVDDDDGMNMDTVSDLNSDLNSDINEYESDVSDNEYVNVEEEGFYDVIENDNYKVLPENDVEFQMLDIDYYHAEDDDGKKTFNIRLFGKTKEGKSVYANVEGFKPYFFVEIDTQWRKGICDRIIKDVKAKVKRDQKEGLLYYEIVKAHKFKGFTNDEEFHFMKLIFNDYDSMRGYTWAFGGKFAMPYISRHRKVMFELYESNMNPILRFLHIRNLDPLGWCKIAKKDFIPFKVDQLHGTTDINVNCNWKAVDRVECSDIHKFKIVSFDIECVSEDGKFPQNRDGDNVIQIGMTYSWVGDPECFKKVMLCLKKTDKYSDDCIVKCYKSEEDLLLAFTNEIRIEDPDIITGYNIFGFDFDYLKNRAKKFGIYPRFSRLSRVDGHVCKYEEQKLESSALGRNNLKYYVTPGRVNIDLMKVIQRDHKLGGYSLDNVAATFIRGDITDYEYIYEDDKMVKTLMNGIKDEFVMQPKDKNNSSGEVDDDVYSSDEEEEHEDDIDDDVHIKKKTTIDENKKKIAYTILKVKSTSGIKKGDYIGVFYNDGPTDNRIGKKYVIQDMDEKRIILKGKIRVRPYLDRKWEVFWCQAKDDVGPQDIFRLFREDSKGRGIIAKYCEKDCTLCNRLMAKLQILPNSIGMGNVCCVPLSYLFLRGQSIKIFSLVAKQCRDENYLIPTNRKKAKPKEQKDVKGNTIETAEEKSDRLFQKFAESLNETAEDDEDDDGYEGATVFDPITGVHYDPIFVGDYSSLYPSSMIMKNLSHNSIVLDGRYLNMPGFKYHEQTYIKPDGSSKTCTFAEKIGDDPNKTKATIPRILMKLLATRKKYNAMKETEKDPFKKAVWDGLQLAYKVTANSLYGQCGSTVSPIAMKDIAACTTSIGRMMLETARDFMEKTLPTIVKYIKIAVEKNNDSLYLKYMRDYYKDVKDTKVSKDEVMIGKDNKPVLDADNKKIMVSVYKGKEEYYQWLKKEIYRLIGKYNISPQCIYGDTDSVFCKLNMVDRETKELFRDKEALKVAIQMGVISTACLNHTFAYPQGLAYEKVYWPFIIVSKKRYVGNLYTFDPDSYDQKSMGLVTKRRDNADIVKVVVGGIIDQILNKRSGAGAVKFTQSRLMRIITGTYGIDKFIISKTLKDKDAYADWTKQVHVVLADRIAQRDQGNKPQSNDRVPYVYIETGKAVKLQGERVEHPQYIIENNLKIDYMFYITNQIMKPATQFLELIAKDPERIFRKYLIREENRKAGIEPIMKYFQDCPKNKGNDVNISLNGIDAEDIKEIKKAPKINTKRNMFNKENGKRKRHPNYNTNDTLNDFGIPFSIS